MTKMEIATYIGMANIMMMGVRDEITEGKELLNSVSEALCAAQLILTNEAIEEYKKVCSEE